MRWSTSPTATGSSSSVEEEDPAAAERRQHRERLLELLERAAAFYVRCLWESAEAAPRGRTSPSAGWSEETLREFRVGYAPSAWDKHAGGRAPRGLSATASSTTPGWPSAAKGEGRIYDRFRRRIMFPLADARGRVLGFGARAMGADQQPKYLNTSDGEVFHKGDQSSAPTSRARRGARPAGRRRPRATPTCWPCTRPGMRNTVGIMGTALTEEQVGELAGSAPTVLLALDADSAGQEAMLRAAAVAAGRKLELRVVPLPEGADPADLVAAQGAEAVRALVDGVGAVRALPGRARARPARDLGERRGQGPRHRRRCGRCSRRCRPARMREELLRRSPTGWTSAPSLVSSWLPPTRRGAAAARRGRNGDAPRPRAPAEVAALDPRRATERDVLAQCIASPDAAARGARATVDEDALHRRR